jgi:glutathione S-transferase
MLTVHHLGRSQSERVVWACEELGLDYELVRYARDPVTVLAPPELKALHPMGSAPLITDGGPLLAESGTIVEYILAKYGDGRLVIAPEAPEFADYLHSFHFANGTLQFAMSRCFYLRRLNLAPDNPVLLAAEGRRERAFRYVNERLNAVPYLAGDVFTAADIMTVFSLTTMRRFVPVELAPYSGILAFSSALVVAKRIAEPWKRETRASRRCWPDRAHFYGRVSARG